MGGSNDLDNIVELTIEEHALAHKKLYEEHGKIEDKIAWLCLSGKTEEGEKLRIKLAQKNFKKFLKNKKNFNSWKKNISKSLKNKKQSDITKEKRSQSLKKAYQENRHKKPTGKILVNYVKSNLKKCVKLAAEGRKKSLKWKESVTSEEYRNKKCLLDPRSKKVFYYGTVYPSIRNASKNININYNKLRNILCKNLDSNIYFTQ
jgi:hypothetical protein